MPWPSAGTGRITGSRPRTVTGGMSRARYPCRRHRGLPKPSAALPAAAGAGHQLITCHVGGTKGLSDALNEHWLEHSTELMSGPQSMVELTRSFVHDVHQDKAWAWTLIRAALDGGFPTQRPACRPSHRDRREDRLRQKRGEISDDLDVGVIGLALFAACITPAILPAFARAYVCLDRSSSTLENLYADQLARMTAALGRRAPGPEPAYGKPAEAGFDRGLLSGRRTARCRQGRSGRGIGRLRSPSPPPCPPSSPGRRS